MTVVAVYLADALCPAERRTIEVESQTIRELAPTDWVRPFVAFVDGAPVLRADWDMVVDSGHAVAFIEVGAIPQGGGGGGSDPLRLILTLAIVVATQGLGGALLGVEGAALVGSFGVAAANAAVTFGALSLMNALIPPPKAPSSQQAATLAAASPTYSLQAQGNAARIDGAIPEHFGTLKAFPDFAAQPYVEFSGNEQYLYQLLCIGRGEYDVASINIEDTPISGFQEITTQLVPPGGAVTLFPANVVSSSEVSGQEMLHNVDIGPFVLNASGTQVNFIGIDFVATRGLYYAEDNGSLSTRSIGVTAYYQAVNAVGTPIGGLLTLFSKTYSGATTTPQRYSERVAVAPGRYRVSVVRSTAKDTATRAGNDIVWAGARGYFPDTRSYGDVTLLAMRLRATNNLSNTSARKINVVATRKLPIWNGTAWSANTATRSPAWALAYACKQVGFTDSQIDLAGLLTLNSTCTARGDRFDGRFDNFLTFWEAISKIAGAVRAKPFMQGGLIRVMRDQAATIPVALFSVRNIVRNSLKIDYILPSADTADAVDVKYFDDTAWTQASVRAALSGSTAATPAKVDLFGVTGRAQAYREGLYIAACNRYRRKVIKFDTEMEGFIPAFGDLISIQHDMPNWGQGGELVAYNSTTRVATLSEPVVFEPSGTHYMGLRARDGSVRGPFIVTAGATALEVVFAAALGFTPDVGTQPRERTHFAFGVGVTWQQRARVLVVKPKTLHTVTIEAINEDDLVHTADSGAATPTLDANTLPRVTNVPVVIGLSTRASPYSPNKIIADWQPAPWATYYSLEISTDNVNWARLGDTGANNFQFDTPQLTTYIRVAAVGTAKGPWAQVTVTVVPPEAVLGLAQEGNFDTENARIKWNATPGASSYRVRIFTGAVLRRESITTDTRYAYSAAEALSDGGLARSLTFQVSAQGLAGAAAPASITLTNAQAVAPVNPGVVAGFGSLTVRSDTPAESDYKGTIVWQGTASGFTRNDASKVYDGPAPNFSLKSNPGTTAWFSMAHYDVFGKDSLNTSGYFSASSLALGGIPVIALIPSPLTTYLGADVYLVQEDDSLYVWNSTATPNPLYEKAAPTVVANQITSIDLKAISASVGELTVGKMRMDAFGYIRGGQTEFALGQGFWLGYDIDGIYKFSIGNSDGNNLTWNGTNLAVPGGAIIAESIRTSALGTYGGGTDPTNTAIGYQAALNSKQAVLSVTVTNGGSGYSAGTVIQAFDPDPGGTPAVFGRTIVGGVITSVTVLSEGSGYSGGATVFANDPAASPGSGALFSAITSDAASNTSIGYQALLTNKRGKQNVSIGSNAAGNLDGGGNINNADNYNVAIGFEAYKKHRQGALNVIIGYRALGAGTVVAGNSTDNVAIGSEALSLATTANYNVAIGRYAMANTQTGLRNTAVGGQALQSLGSTTSGAQNDNTALGADAGRDMQLGQLNTIIGKEAAYLIGQIGQPSYNVSYSNFTCLGYRSAITGSNQVQLGNSSTITYVYGTVQNRSDARDKADVRDTVLGLDFLRMLRPVDYRLDYREDYVERVEGGAINHPRDGSKKRTRFHHGLIAQEVRDACGAAGVDFGGWQDHSIAGGTDVLSIGYDELIAPLIRAAQQLADRVEILEAELLRTNLKTPTQ